MGTRVIVVGAGLSGLTSALILAEAGFRVRVIAKEPPSRTTSAAAGADWGPYLSDDRRLLGWSEQTRQTLVTIAGTEPSAGVTLVHGLEAERFPVPTPTWAVDLPDFAVCAPADLPPGYAVGWWFTAPVVDMPRYLEYLEARLYREGMAVELEAVSSLSDMTRQADIVVNCSGLGSRELAADASLLPVRGQLVVVANPPDNPVTRFFQDHGSREPVTYYLPQGDKVILGGCAQEGSENLEVDYDLAEAIIARCAAIAPQLGTAAVVEHRVGLRPSRPSVRLEVEWVDGRPVIHNYGHGGSGLTMSWGCAASVLALARALAVAADRRG
jgi:D-amino-acid oxidase